MPKGYMNRSKDSFVINNILRHVKGPRSQGPLYSALLSCLLPTFYDYNAEGKNMTKTNKHISPLCFSSVCLFVTSFLYMSVTCVYLICFYTLSLILSIGIYKYILVMFYYLPLHIERKRLEQPWQVNPLVC